jgi:phosphatidylglycerophosphate synthase
MMPEETSGSEFVPPRTLADLKRVCLKKVDAWDSNHLYRPISIRLTWLLVRTPIRPNTITVLGGLIGIVGAFLFMLPSMSMWVRLGGLALIQLAIVFDHIDGELARATRRFSPGGPFLDTFVTELAIHLGVATALAASLYLEHPTLPWLVAAAAFILLKALSIATFYVRGFMTERKKKSGGRVEFPPPAFSLRYWLGSLFWEVRRLSNTILVAFVVQMALVLGDIPFPVVYGIEISPLVAVFGAGLFFLAFGLAGSVYSSGRGNFDVNMDPYV